MKILDGDHCVAVLRTQLDLTGFVAPDEELATIAISLGEMVNKIGRRIINISSCQRINLNE